MSTLDQHSLDDVKKQAKRIMRKQKLRTVCQRKGCNKPAKFPTRFAQCEEHHKEYVNSGNYLQSFQWKKGV